MLYPEGLREAFQLVVWLLVQSPSGHRVSGMPQRSAPVMFYGDGLLAPGLRYRRCGGRNHDVLRPEGSAVRG
jgi:hypothetical protein